MIPWLGKTPGEGNDNLLAWEMPWIEEPGRVQSVGAQRTGRDLETKQHTKGPISNHWKHWVFINIWTTE